MSGYDCDTTDRVRHRYSGRGSTEPIASSSLDGKLDFLRAEARAEKREQKKFFVWLLLGCFEHHTVWGTCFCYTDRFNMVAVDRNDWIAGLFVKLFV